MSPVTRRHLTVGGIVGAVGLIGASLGMGVDWIIDRGAKLDKSGATIDTLVAHDSLNIEWRKRVNHRLRIQSDSLRVLTRRPQEGLVRRWLRKLL